MNVSNRFGKLLLTTGGIGIVLVLLLCAIGPAAAAPQYLAVHKVYVTNVREGEFTVSWTTDLPSNAIVRFGLTPALGSTRSDPVSAIYTHQVIVDGLLPNTTYFFEVESGGVVDNNGGSYYTATSAPLSGSPPSPLATVYGNVTLVGGAPPVPYTLVYLRLIDADGVATLGSSQWVSARADATGLWFYTLGSDRSEDLSQYFTYTAGEDLLQIVWQGGPAGTVGAVGSEYYDLVPGVDTQIDVQLDGEPTAISAHSFSADGGQVRQWIAPVLAGLLLAVLALLGMQLRLAERKA